MMKEHTPADIAALAVVAKRTSDIAREFQHRPALQWDRMDRLINEVSAIVDELKDLRDENRKGKRAGGRDA